MTEVTPRCTDWDLEGILEVINDAAQAYNGVIPDDRFKEPYMPSKELRREIEHGVRFWGFEQDGQLLGVMGLQDVENVTLIRHAYVKTTHRRRGIGGQLLIDLRSRATRPLLVGTWAAAGLEVDGVTDTAASGYTRIAIRSTADLAVDNLDVESVLSAIGIMEEHMPST